MPTDLTKINLPEGFTFAGGRQVVSTDGERGCFLAVKLPCDLSEQGQEEIRDILDRVDLLLTSEVIRAAPNFQENREEMLRKLRALFGTYDIRSQEIPNGYSNHPYYTLTRPWVKVTTKFGDIIVGWRKRVIQISWEGSDLAVNGHQLFADVDDTKDLYLVHAYTWEDATERIHRLMKAGEEGQVKQAPKKVF